MPLASSSCTFRATLYANIILCTLLPLLSNACTYASWQVMWVLSHFNTYSPPTTYGDEFTLSCRVREFSTANAALRRAPMLASLSLKSIRSMTRTISSGCVLNILMYHGLHERWTYVYVDNRTQTKCVQELYARVITCPQKHREFRNIGRKHIQSLRFFVKATFQNSCIIVCDLVQEQTNGEQTLSHMK